MGTVIIVFVECTAYKKETLIVYRKVYYKHNHCILIHNRYKKSKSYIFLMLLVLYVTVFTLYFQR